MDKLFDEEIVLAVDNFFRSNYSIIDGVRTLTHFDAAVYTARRLEMLRIADATLFYLVKRPVVHSELSGLPFMTNADARSNLRKMSLHQKNKTGLQIAYRLMDNES